MFLHSDNWPTLSIGWLNLAATWWLQSALLLLIGFIAAKCLRTSVLQSVIYRTTLAAILLCPLLTQLLSSCGFR